MAETTTSAIDYSTDPRFQGTEQGAEAGEQTKEYSENTKRIASMYASATATYNHMMEPIHQINEYVGKKNEFDAQLADGTLTQEAFDEQVKSLQTEYFGDDARKLAVANKFEAVVDWSEKYGLDKFGESISGVTASIKDAFSKTTLGQKWEDVKMAAADIESEKEATADNSAETTTTEEITAEATVEGAEDTAKTAERAQRAEAVLDIDTDAEQSIEAEAEMG